MAPSRHRRPCPQTRAGHPDWHGPLAGGSSSRRDQDVPNRGRAASHAHSQKPTKRPPTRRHGRMRGGCHPTRIAQVQNRWAERGGGERARAVRNYHGRPPGCGRRRSAPKSGRGPQQIKAGGVPRRHQTAVHASVRGRDGCSPSPRRWQKSTQSAGAATPRRRRGAVRAGTSVPCIGRAATGIGAVIAVPPMGQS